MNRSAFLCIVFLLFLSLGCVGFSKKKENQTTRSFQPYSALTDKNSYKKQEQQMSSALQKEADE